MSEFTGARGSNTGDDFHELWATRHAIRLLSEENGLLALTVEGVPASDEAATNSDEWEGVDCALFFGGRNGSEATRVEIEQLKYSAANRPTNAFLQLSKQLSTQLKLPLMLNRQVGAD